MNRGAAGGEQVEVARTELFAVNEHTSRIGSLEFSLMELFSTAGHSIEIEMISRLEVSREQLLAAESNKLALSANEEGNILSNLY